MQTQLKASAAQFNQLSSLAASVKVLTSTEGCALIDSDLSRAKEERVTLVTDCDSLVKSLEEIINTWTELERIEETVVKWIKSTEQKLKHLSLKSTLKEKQLQAAELVVIEN